MTDPTPVDEDHAALDLLIRGFQVSRMIRLVADLAIADKVPESGRRDVRDLAEACAVRPAPLLRVLRALAAFGIFRIVEDGHIAHSPRSLLLRVDSPKSLYPSARFWAAPGSWGAWGALDVALTSGTPFRAVWNASRFQYLREHPEEARIFDAYMAQFPDDRHNAIAEAYDFSRAARIADIGGGNGETLRRILARFPTPCGLVFDLEDVVGAIPLAARLEGRIDVEGGSFFERVPSAADVYLLVRVLHNWSDDDCIRILQACRAAMGRDACLLVVDHLLEPVPALGHPFEYLVDTHMMAMFGGARERTQSEFDALFEASGFTAQRVVRTASTVSIIEIIAT